jgi:hypothetical protein
MAGVTCSLMCWQRQQQQATSLRVRWTNWQGRCKVSGAASVLLAVELALFCCLASVPRVYEGVMSVCCDRAAFKAPL